MRRRGEESAPRVRLKPREKRERHDESRDAEREPAKSRERDDPHLRVAPRREEISSGEKKGNQEKKIFLEGEEGDGRLLTFLSIDRKSTRLNSSHLGISY